VGRRTAPAPSGADRGDGVRHSIVTDHESDPESDSSENVERRGGDRRGDEDRRQHDEGPPNGVERRKGQRRRGERRSTKSEFEE